MPLHIRLQHKVHIISNLMSYKEKHREFRNQFRKEQLENYRSQLRQKMLNFMIEEQLKEQVNNKVMGLIANKDIDGLYEQLYKQEQKNIGILTPKTINLLLPLLLSNLQFARTLLMLGSVFDLQYQTIFLHEQTQQRAKQIVRVIYEATNSYVSEYAKRGNDTDLQKTINGLLSVLKRFIFNKEQCNQHGYSFSEGVRQDHIINYLFPWFQVLHKNPHYLIILTLVECDISFSQFEPIRKKLNEDNRIMMILLENIDLSKQQPKSISIPSLTLANFLVKTIENKQILERVVVPFLQLSKKIFSYITGNYQLEHIRKYTFVQIISNVRIIFQQLSNINMHKHLSQLMADANYWVFSGILLNTETFIVRSQIAQIIKFAVKNTLLCNGQLHQYISQTMISALGQGLECQNVDIILSCLETFNMITSYCLQASEETKQLQQWINQYDIDTGLTNLEHQPNKAISQGAQMLIQKRDSLYKHLNGEMEAEIV